MKHIVPYLGTTAVVGLAAFALSYKAAAPTKPTAVPFFLVTEIRDAHGGLIAVTQVARRTDGATFSSETYGDPARGEIQGQVEFQDGRRITIAPSVRLKTSWPARTGRSLELWLAQQLPADRCVGRGKQVGTDYFQAEPVEIHEGGAGKTRIIMWIAPRLGCERLEYKAQDTSLGVLTARGVVTQLQYGDPDPALFEVPDYPEAKPSVMMRELLLKSGENPSVDDEAGWKRLDQEFEAQQPAPAS